MAHTVHPGQQLTGNPLLQFQREARLSFESVAGELPAHIRHQPGFPRLWAFAKAMFFRLTPARRIVLLFALALMVNFVLNGSEASDTSYRLLLSAVCLLVLLALELADRVALKRDLELARDIQGWLVPRCAPEQTLLDVAFHTRPANTVAGDYYDVLPLPGGRAAPAVLFVVADVAGKGIPAGLLMACFRTCLHTLADTARDLADLVDRLNRSCCRDSNQGRRFTSAFLAQYDGSVLRYVNAGHNPPMLRRAMGAITQFGASGVPFGMFPNAAYDVSEVPIEPGDLLLLYTDGVVEAENDAGEQYGVDRLYALLQTASGTSAQVQERLLTEIESFTGQAPQHDDITCLIARFPAPVRE